ncbi:MAG: tRNA lysidine(34) synthetase TilS [Clostridia bacterium]|jgi:tRNA(Ile)-lysidine synthase
MIKLDINDNLISDKNWYVAFSGGPDSSCLLYLLIKKKEQIEKDLKVKIKLSAIHINHNLRQAESLRDMDFCKNICKHFNVEFLPFSVDVNHLAKSEKLTIEQAARTLRYEIFDKYADGCVFLGHNKDDNSETIFMNIIRGTGLQGLCGMEKVSGHYFRPLLGYTKKQIVAFNHLNGIDYILDSSNNKNDYLRNFIRNDIFPMINCKTKKDVSSNLNSMAELIKQAESYIEKNVDLEFKRIVTLEKQSVIIDISDFSDLENIIASGIIRKSILYVKGVLKDVERKHIDIIRNMIARSQSGSVVDLKDDIKVLLLQNKRMRIFREAISGTILTRNVQIEGKTYISEKDMNVIAETCVYNGGAVFDEKSVMLDYESVKEGLVLRNRMPKDFISPYKGNGTKTLKKYFIDSKIDNDMRDTLFILAIENEIVYIENKELGKRFHPKKGEKALRLEFIYNERTV